MIEPGRSATLKRALAAEGDGLPENFAVQVAVLADTEDKGRRPMTSDAAMFGACIVMISACVAGWFEFVGTPEIGNAELFGLIGGVLASQPWLVIGMAGVAVVQMLTFLRRAMT
jgi:hypothetical protein